MTTAATALQTVSGGEVSANSRAWRRFSRHRLAVTALVLFVIITLSCVGSLYWSRDYYQQQELSLNREAPRLAPAFAPFGYDVLGRNLFWRCLFGGAVSLGIGFAAAVIAVVIGTTVGMIAGWSGGWVDAAIMRVVDVMYGLPYVLMVILLKVAFEAPMMRFFEHTWGPGHEQLANMALLFLAIGGVSWLTMARVIRGQTLSLKEQGFVESARAMGLSTPHILARHILPNLIGPIIVYATLTVPQAILQESFLSFLGIGIQAPLPTWGSLASDGVKAINPVVSFWWIILFPCVLLAVTLLCLNFVGDGLRDAFDPRSQQKLS